MKAEAPSWLEDRFFFERNNLRLDFFDTLKYGLLPDISSHQLKSAPVVRLRVPLLHFVPRSQKSPS